MFLQAFCHAFALWRAAPSRLLGLGARAPVCALALLSATVAGAAGIRCDQARLPAEVAVCGDTELLRLDAQLAALYSGTSRLPGPQRADMAAAQKQWQRSKDACAADKSCLVDRYTRRISELHEGLSAYLAYKPDAVDQAALAELRQATEHQLKTHGEMGLKQALDAVSIRKGLTSFSNARDENAVEEPAHFPALRPHGVTADEWRALRRSHIEAGGENGSASYTLLDMDGDGQRDLIMESYEGGTGLWSYTSVLRRQGARFVSPKLAAASGQSGETVDEPLYSVNGRGANQQVHWVMLQNRVYAAYVDSHYGEDAVALLRPLQINRMVPTLTVRYRYALSVPRKQARDDKTQWLDLETVAAVNQGLAWLQDRPAGAGDTPLCPVPDDATDADLYSSFGPGHYTFEVVGDFPVWFGSECRLGRLVDWFGGYGA